MKLRKVTGRFVSTGKVSSFKGIKSKPNMKAKNKNLTSLEEFKEKNYGKIGTKERDELEAGYENFKISAFIHNDQIEKGMTQEQLYQCPNNH